MPRARTVQKQLKKRRWWWWWWWSHDDVDDGTGRALYHQQR